MGRAISHSCNRPDLFHRASSHRRGPKGVVAMHQLSQSESFRGQVQRAVRKDPASQRRARPIGRVERVRCPSPERRAGLTGSPFVGDARRGPDRHRGRPAVILRRSMTRSPLDGWSGCRWHSIRASVPP
jgi:hypothetical protein